MDKYKCYNCGYGNDDKTKMKNHLNRKNKCKCLYDNDINLDECKQYILDGMSHDDYLTKLKYNMLNNTNNTTNNTNLQCTHCDKKFKHKSSLYKHLKICKNKKTENEAKKYLEELVKLLNLQIKDQKNELTKKDKIIASKDNTIASKDNTIISLSKKAGITQINNIQNNIQNNVVINSFNNTDLSHVTDKIVKQGLSKSVHCIPELIELIHFDKDKPENHNIYIPNIKNNDIMLYDGDKWTANDRGETIDILLDRYENFYTEYIDEEWTSKGKSCPRYTTNFKNYREKIKDKNVLKHIEKAIETRLYENRGMIIKITKFI